MKRKFATLSSLLLLAGAAQAGSGLYYEAAKTPEPSPLKWTAGISATWDDNVAPNTIDDGEAAYGVAPYVGLSVSSVSPQTTWDLYGRLGFIYYFDAPDAIDEFNSESRVGFNLTHRFDDRLRFVTQNYLSYEMEPDYSYGYTTKRQLGEYLFYKTDNAIGYRWSDQIGSYTGFTLDGVDYSDVDNQDRFSFGLYHQMRYTLSRQTTLTGEYRYRNTSADGLASDSQSHYLLAGVEQRINETSVAVLRAGAQFYEVDNGDDTTSPFVEAAYNTQINQMFSLRSFLRYGVEAYDTTRLVGNGIYDFDDRTTLRIGISGRYALSQTLSFMAGVDYIPSTFDSGRRVAASGFAPATQGEFDEDIVSLYVGAEVKLTEYLYGTLSYNFTDVDSDFANSSYDRNRVNVGVRAEF